MDSNEKKNESDSVPGFESSEVKIEPQGELAEKSGIIKEKISFQLKKINAIVDKKLEDIETGQKRRNSEKCKSNNMEKEESSISPNESVKRRRYSDTKNVSAMLNYSQSTGGKEFSLLVRNSPGEWSSQQVVDYVNKKCNVNLSRINDSREENTESDFKISIELETKERLEQVLKKLKEEEAKGNLTVQINDIKNESESDVESDHTVHIEELKDSDDLKQVDNLSGTSKPDEDTNLDSSNYYIRKDYLESLGITVPVTNWVTVTNIRCDKSELKEVLELAGRVLICSVCANSTKYANVMYSHPLEAVQAVSMLNGQQLYGNNLKVTMKRVAQNQVLLPKGLVDIGPGLGKLGKPLPDLDEQYKRLIKGKETGIDARLFEPSLLKKVGITIDEDATKFVRAISTPNSQSSQNDAKDSEPPVDKQNTDKIGQFGPVGQRLYNTGNINPAVRPQIQNRPAISPRPVPMPGCNPLQVPVRGSATGPMVGPRGPIPIAPRAPGFHMVPNPAHVFPSCPPIPGIEAGGDDKNGGLNGMMGGPRPILRGPTGPRVPMAGPNRFPVPGNPMMGPRPVGPVMVPHRPIVTPNGPIRPSHPYGPNVRMFKCPDPVMVQITNLPLTTNFVNLGQKLAELGHVVFLEFTTPGCANVRFATPADAERCIQNYRNVMG